MTRLLLTTVCRPVGGHPDDGPSIGVDVMKGQLCVNQGVFRTSGVGWAYGLEYIAANLNCPTVVLHWPSHKELTTELHKQHYDYVGVSFVFQLTPRMIETVELIRRESPRSQIVLGGYGTSLDGVARYADHVCPGEGIRFMRSLLNERVGQPIEHPLIVYGNHLLSLPVSAGRKVVLCTGLGCSEGCDFCASSHKFGYRYVPFVTDGEAMFRLMEERYNLTGIDEFQVMDENFLVNEERAKTMADFCERNHRFFDFFTFSSVKALSRYSADELCRIGVSAVWVGLEGKKAGYDKLHGEQLAQLVQRLKHHGILVCGSMIVGFDYQTSEIIRQELDEILSLEPTYLQCLMYGPAPGTRLYQRMEKEDRWIGGGFGSGTPFGKCDGFALTFRHPHLSAEEMSALQKECYYRDLQHSGLSLFRAIETWLEGYVNLKDSSQEFLRARAEIYARKLRACRALVKAGMAYAPNDEIRRRMNSLRTRLVAEFGSLTTFELLLERAILPAAAKWTRFKEERNLFQEPRLIRRRYRC